MYIKMRMWRTRLTRSNSGAQSANVSRKLPENYRALLYGLAAVKAKVRGGNKGQGAARLGACSRRPRGSSGAPDRGRAGRGPERRKPSAGHSAYRARSPGPPPSLVSLLPMPTLSKYAHHPAAVLPSSSQNKLASSAPFCGASTTSNEYYAFQARRFRALQSPICWNLDDRVAHRTLLWPFR